MSKQTFKPILSNNTKSFNKNKESDGISTKAFKPFHSPVEVKDLLLIEEFNDILANGFNYIQYRKDSVFHLSNELFGGVNNVHKRDTHSTPIRHIFSEIKNKYAKREKTVWIIDFTKYKSLPYEIFERLSNVRKTDNIGVCIRSPIEDIPIESLEYFDLLFFFDMSDKMLDKLRSFISIPQNYIEKLRTGTKLRGEPVMVFVNHKRIISNDIPIFSTNPFIVSCNSSLVSVGSTTKEIRNMSNFNSTTNNIGSVGIFQQGDNNIANNNFPASELIQLKQHLKDNEINVSSGTIEALNKAIKEESKGNLAEAQGYLKKIAKELLSVGKNVGSSVLTKYLESLYSKSFF